MSKWGYVSTDLAKRKFENDPDEAARMVSEMASAIIDQEKTIDGLKDEIMSLQTTVAGARAAEAHMRGYIERVRELDGKPEKGSKE